jgi:hypothetical protein
LVGRSQNLLELSLRIESDKERPVLLEVYWSMPPKREPSHGEQKPHPTDVLLDAVRQPDEFSHVLGRWLDRQQEWRDARLRFCNSFAKQQHYDIDRLIGSANMFDILPKSAVPPRKRSLQQKIRYRAERLKKEVGKRFPELDMVIDEALSAASPRSQAAIAGHRLETGTRFSESGSDRAT